MKKSATLFLLAILLPSGLLGWLALRSAEEQQIVLERRTAALYQTESDNVATAIRALIEDQRRSFTETTRQLLSTTPPQELASRFAPTLVTSWPRKAVGFALGAEGRLLSPLPAEAKLQPEWKRFLQENGDFLSSQSTASVYSVPIDALALSENLRNNIRQDAKQSISAAGIPQPEREAKAEPQSTSAPKLGAALSTMPGAPISNAEKAGPAPPEESALGGLPTARAKLQNASSQSLGASGEIAKPAAVSSEAKFGKAGGALQSTSDKADAPKVADVVAEKAIITPDIALRSDALLSLPTISPETPQIAFAKDHMEEAVKLRSEPLALLKAPAKQWTAPIQTRNVSPQQLVAVKEPIAFSQLVSATADFKELTNSAAEGMLTRFVQTRLELIFWIRPSQDSDLIFGCVMDSENLRDLWPRAFPSSDQNGKGDFLLALLDDKARPVIGGQQEGIAPDWKRPFVATEIGEALPHWEAALYLRRPDQLSKNAKTVRRTFYLLVFTALAAIASAGWLVVADTRRQVLLAEKKADFVSNVSHELKTPLTSIRMFAELMQGGQVEPERSSQYLRIILVEAERLTRLINNVLDFSRINRDPKPIVKRRLLLNEVVHRLWEGQEIHLKEKGFKTSLVIPEDECWVLGDEDSIAQILINLLSNAEKYSGPLKEISLELHKESQWVFIRILDRGRGVPKGEESKIFEAFYRANDSLSSGIQGSGLGLTLASRHAVEHGGKIVYSQRAGGGSEFTLQLPLDVSQPA